MAEFANNEVDERLYPTVKFLLFHAKFRSNCVVIFLKEFVDGYHLPNTRSLGH